jgi:hypothetical protein
MGNTERSEVIPIGESETHWENAKRGNPLVNFFKIILIFTMAMDLAKIAQKADGSYLI